MRGKLGAFHQCLGSHCLVTEGVAQSQARPPPRTPPASAHHGELAAQAATPSPTGPFPCVSTEIISAPSPFPGSLVCGLPSILSNFEAGLVGKWGIGWRWPICNLRCLRRDLWGGLYFTLHIIRSDQALGPEYGTERAPWSSPHGVAGVGITVFPDFSPKTCPKGEQKSHHLNSKERTRRLKAQRK